MGTEQKAADAGRSRAEHAKPPTKASTLDELETKIATAFQAVKKRVSFFDTVQILMTQGIWKDLFQELDRQSGKVIPGRSRCLRYPWLVRIQQPTQEALQTLVDARERILVNRVDVAFDFETPTWHRAEQLHSFFRLHLTQPWHGHGASVVEVAECTTYYRRAGEPRNIVLYVDKSKCLFTHCLHLEIRTFGHAHCLRYGMGTLSDLLNFGNHEALALLARNCRLTSLNPSSLRRGIEKFESDKMRTMSRREKPMTRAEVQRWMRNYVAALVQTSDGRPDMTKPWEASAQHWIDHFPAVAKHAAVHSGWRHALANKEIEHSFLSPMH